MHIRPQRSSALAAQSRLIDFSRIQRRHGYSQRIVSRASAPSVGTYLLSRAQRRRALQCPERTVFSRNGARRSWPGTLRHELT